MKQKDLEKLVDKMDAEIMDWFYEAVKINFDVDMVQDSSDLRAILEENLSFLSKTTPPPSQGEKKR